MVSSASLAKPALSAGSQKRVLFTWPAGPDFRGSLRDRAAVITAGQCLGLDRIAAVRIALLRQRFGIVVTRWSRETVCCARYRWFNRTSTSPRTHRHSWARNHTWDTRLLPG